MRFKRLDNAINKKNWVGVNREVTRLINTGQLDVWYDYPFLNDTVIREGYSCYTCLMKANGAYNRSNVCYEGRSKDNGKDLRYRHCGLRDFTKYMGGYFAPLLTT